MQHTDAAPRTPGAAPFPRCFPATFGHFHDQCDRDAIDALAAWAAATFAEALRERPSLHVYVRSLPPDATALVARLRESEAILGAIRARVAEGQAITPLAHTDELYVSHYNKDRGGDQGLFDKHYDGNLRVLPVGAVVRALVYLRSDASYKVVFSHSGVEKAFATYDFGLLDFHRELHWVEGEYRPDNPPRMLLKCNYLVAPSGARALTRALDVANTGVFYVVKAAMEYSKSPNTPAQRAVGMTCNLFRVLNNVHPVLPLVPVLAVLVGAAALARHLTG